MSAMPTSLVTAGSAERVHGDLSVNGENPWADYFGPTAVPMKTNAYERYSAQNYDLPEAYRGKNIYLRDTLNDLITGAGRTAFYTETLLPWEQTDQISFAWNEFHFNEQLAGRVPHEGVSRLVTSSKRSRHDKSVRRGLAMVLEHGFMGTADGMEMYRRNMIGIAQSVQETANHDVMSAVLSAEAYDRQWEANHGVVKLGLERMVEDEVYRFGAVQKQEHGLDMLVEDTKKRMGRYGVVADTLIIPPKMSVYMSMVRPEKSHYYMGGQLATANVKTGGAVTSFRNLSVFETRSFDVYNGEPPIDLTLRPRQVGEYYVMGVDDVSIDIYNQQTDAFVTFTKPQLQAAHNAVFTTAVFDSKFTDGTEIQIVSARTALSGEDALAQLVTAQKRRWHASTPVASAASQRHQQQVSKVLEADGWRVAENAGRRLCPQGHVCYSLVGNARLSAHSVPPQFTQESIVAGQSHYSVPRTLVDEAVVRHTDGAGTRFSMSGSAQGKQKIERVSAVAALRADQILGDAAAQTQLATDLVSLFALSSQTAEFQDCFSGSAAVLSDARVDVDAAGWSGHCGLHMSYAGLGIIAGNAAAAQVEAAQRWLGAVDSAYDAGLTARPGAMLLVARSVPQHYLTCPGGGTAAGVTDEDVAKAFLFSVMSNSRYGHSLVPIASDGTVALRHRGLRGDSLLCPSYSVGRFYTDRKGVVAGLALVNASIGLTGVTAPAQVPEVIGSRWQLGRPMPGSPLQPLVAAPTEDPGRAPDKRQRAPAVPERELLPDVDAAHWAATQLARGGSTGLVHAGVQSLAALHQLVGHGFDNDAATAVSTNPGTDTTRVVADNDELKKTRVNRNDGAWLLMRPFIEHQMHSVVMMKAGGDTGKTYYGHNNVTVGDDAIRKMHYVNLTFYSKAVVRESKNISVIPDVYLAGYNGGNGVKFYSSAQQIKDMDHSKREEQPSLLVATLAPSEIALLPNPLSITGKFPKQFNDKPENVHYAFAPFLASMFELRSLVNHDDAFSSAGFFKHSRPVNTICFRGAHITTRSANPGVPNSPKMRTYHPNTGHLGPTYAGVKAVRAGQNKYMLSEFQLETMYAQRFHQSMSG
jgi:hypothetical protein